MRFLDLNTGDPINLAQLKAEYQDLKKDGNTEENTFSEFLLNVMEDTDRRANDIEFMDMAPAVIRRIMDRLINRQIEEHEEQIKRNAVTVGEIVELTKWNQQVKIKYASNGAEVFNSLKEFDFPFDLYGTISKGISSDYEAIIIYI